jgi:hypothetical protein
MHKFIIINKQFYYHAKFVVSTAVPQRIMASWEVTPCLWATCSSSFEGLQNLQLEEPF